MAARKGDLLIRYGGEEFVIILPGAGKEDCLFVAERLRHMVEESVVVAADTQIRVTVSVGAVSYPEYACENELDLIKIADKALYAAKDKGRNIVVSY
jgi:diguanylate cyclase (GGDEF)-like protein